MPFDILTLLANKDKLADRIKGEVPGLLDMLLTVISAECGAADGDATSVEFFHANTAKGPTTMARVHRIDQTGERVQELGVIDVPAALRAVPNETITKLFPF